MKSQRNLFKLTDKEDFFLKRIRLTASLLIIALMISLPAWAGTFKDDFSDGNFDGWQILDGLEGGSVWKVENGVLTSKRQSPWACGIFFGENGWRNYSIECDAKMVEGFPVTWNSMGLFLRLWRVRVVDGVWFDLNALWYIASKTSRAAWIWPRINGKDAGQSVQKAFDLQLNRWYHLKGVASEENFEFYVNGELLISLKDSVSPTGYLSLNTRGSIIHFDNVVITGDDIPDNAFAVAPQGKLATSWGRLKSQ